MSAPSDGNSDGGTRGSGVHDPPARSAGRCRTVPRDPAGGAEDGAGGFRQRLASESGRPPEWFAERLETSSVFGAFQGDGLLGVAAFRAERAAKRAHKGELWGLYVRRKARGAGVARRLIGAVLDHATGKVELISLAVERRNMRARRLYTSLGFVEYGLEKNAIKIGDRYFDDVLMAKSLA